MSAFPEDGRQADSDAPRSPYGPRAKSPLLRRFVAASSCFAVAAAAGVARAQVRSLDLPVAQAATLETSVAEDGAAWILAGRHAVGDTAPRYSLFSRVTRLANRARAHSRRGQLRAPHGACRRSAARARLPAAPRAQQAPGTEFTLRARADAAAAVARYVIETPEPHKARLEPLVREFQTITAYWLSVGPSESASASAEYLRSIAAEQLLAEIRKLDDAQRASIAANRGRPRFFQLHPGGLAATRDPPRPFAAAREVLMESLRDR